NLLIRVLELPLGNADDDRFGIELRGERGERGDDVALVRNDGMRRCEHARVAHGDTDAAIAVVDGHEGHARIVRRVQLPDFGGNPHMKNFNLDAILEAMLKISDRVSDLNFSVGRPPQVEVDGQLVAVNFPGLPRLTPYQTEMITLHMLRGDRELTRTLMMNGSV